MTCFSFVHFVDPPLDFTESLKLPLIFRHDFSSYTGSHSEISSIKARLSSISKIFSSTLCAEFLQTQVEVGMYRSSFDKTFPASIIMLGFSGRLFGIVGNGAMRHFNPL